MSPWVSEKNVSRPHREELINHLLNLCRIFSPSGYELAVIEYCLPILESHGFLALVSPEGNIYATRGMPDSGKYVLLNAHMDTVQTQHDAAIMDNPELVQYDKFWNVVSGRGYMVGGDDKAGVAAILTLASQTDLPMKVLLTVREETHAIGAEMVPPTFYDDVIFAITLDRRHCCDLVDYYCGYVTAPRGITDLIIQIAKESNMVMKTADGSYADTAVITKYVPAVNLSIGYYNAHSSQDFIRVNETYDTMMLTMKCILRRNEFADVISELKKQQLQKPPKDATELPAVSRWSYQYGMKIPEKKKKEEEEIIAKRYEKCPIDKDCPSERREYYQGADLVWAEGYNRAWAELVAYGRAPPPPPPPQITRVWADTREFRRASFLPAFPLNLEEERAFGNIMSHLITKYPVITVRTPKIEEITIELKAPSGQEAKKHSFGWMIFSAPNKTTSYTPLYPDRGTVLEISRVYVASKAASESIGSEMFSLIRQIDGREDAETPIHYIQEPIPELVTDFHNVLKIINNKHHFFKLDEESMDLYSAIITYHKKGRALATVEIYQEIPSQAPFKFRSKFIEEVGIYPDYESMQIVYGMFFREDKFRGKMEALMREAREVLKRPKPVPRVGAEPVPSLPAPKVKADQILDDPEAIRQFVATYGDWSLTEAERLDVMYCITQIAGALGKKQKIIKMLKKGPAMFQYQGSLIHPTINSVLGLYYHITYIEPPKAPTACYREYMKRIIARVEKIAELPDLRETPETTPIAAAGDITDTYNDLEAGMSDFIAEYSGTLGRDAISFEIKVNEPEKIIYAWVEFAADEKDPELFPRFTVEVKVHLNLFEGAYNICDILMIIDDTTYEMGEALLPGLKDALWDLFGLPALEDQMEQLAEEGFNVQSGKETDDSFGEL